MPTSARPSRRALIVALATIPLVLMASCSQSGSSGASSPGTGASQAPTSVPPGAAAPGAGTCNADYCVPASWDTALAPTPLAAIRPFIEPLNVVISARSTVSLAQLQAALGNWKTVSTASSVTVAGIHLKCISSEDADVSGAGYAYQDVAWRLGGCLGGNELSLSGTEDHVRIWAQAVPGSRQGAWFAAASIETMCVADHGTLKPAADDKLYAIVHSGDTYHCVDGGPGSLTSRYSDGYNDGAELFVAAIAAAARARGWTLARQVIPRQVAAGAGSGEGGVPFSSSVYVLTLTTAS